MQNTCQHQNSQSQDIDFKGAWREFQRLKLYEEKGKLTEELRWKKHIEPYWKNANLTDVTAYTLADFRKNLETKELSPQTVSHILSLLRRVINQMYKWGRYTGPLPVFTMPKFDNRAVRFLEKEEVELLLFHLRKRSVFWHDFALLALLTGCRSGELFKLTKQDFDINNNIIHIRDTKNCRSRNVPLTEMAYNVLEKYGKNENFYLFAQDNGQVRNRVPRLFREVVKELEFNLGIEDRRHKVTFHTLRHTAASWMVQSGVNLVIVSNILGHSSLKVTMRYAHLAPNQSQSAVATIEEKLYL